MAKELPYFRFTVSEWLQDDISLERYELKGFFMDVCAYYWFKDCNVDLKSMEKKFSNAKDLLKELIDLNIIKNNFATGLLQINFLDSQYKLLLKINKKRVEAGRSGGLKKSSNAKDLLKQKRSYKYKDNNKDKYKDKEYKTSLLSDLKKSDFTNSKYFEITIAFYELFKTNLSDLGISTTTLEKAKGVWIDNIRLMIEVDKYKIEDFHDVFKYLQTDEFWKPNILSTKKLREKFDKLLINARQNEKNQSNKGCSLDEFKEVATKHFG